ncbi:MAG: DUF192 domain-containing protein, partial [Nitrospirales bacterium]
AHLTTQMTMRLAAAGLALLSLWSWGDPLASAMSRSQAFGASPDATLVPITTPNGTVIQGELADTTEKRVRGLMFREHLPSNRGMLFAFPEAQQWTIWMKNTKIPLDIIWLDHTKAIVHIERNVPICTRQDEGCPQYQPIKKAMYVLEVAGGVADRLKLQRGLRLQFELPSSLLGHPPLLSK